MGREDQRVQAVIRHDEVGRQVHQLGRQPRQKGKIAVGEPELEDDIAAFDITEVAQPPSERIEDRRSVAVCRRQNADARDLPGALLSG